MKLPFAYRENVEGLCGDWNSNKLDDLRTRDGVILPFTTRKKRSFEQTDSEFEMAVSWIVPNEDGTKPILGPMPSKIDAELDACPHIQFCNEMFNENWISDCVNLIDTTPFIEVSFLK